MDGEADVQNLATLNLLFSHELVAYSSSLTNTPVATIDFRLCVSLLHERKIGL
jgi:hypothetical protein